MSLGLLLLIPPGTVREGVAMWWEASGRTDCGLSSPAAPKQSRVELCAELCRCFCWFPGTLGVGGQITPRYALLVTWLPTVQKSRPGSKPVVVSKSRLMTRRLELGAAPEVKRRQLCSLPLPQMLGAPLDLSGHKDINVELLTVGPGPAGVSLTRLPGNEIGNPRGDPGCLPMPKSSIKHLRLAFWWY